MTDIIDIMSDGEWHKLREIAEELYRRDPVRYRTACQQTVATKVWKLHAKQGGTSSRSTSMITARVPEDTGW